MNKEETSKKTYEGTIKITAKPIGFVDIDPENKDKNKPEDVIIFEEDLNCALNRDKVEIEIIGTEPGRRGSPARPKGKVTKILERNRTDFVGALKKDEKENDKFLLIPDDFKVYKALEVTGEDLKDGYKAMAELTEWTDPKINPKGIVKSIIGVKGVHETEMQSIILSKGILYNFPPEVEKEAIEISDRERARMEEEAKLRRDFRGITTCTIDPAGAKDFDDALSYEEVDTETVRVGVHIADVSHFVVPGSQLDKEAKKESSLPT